MRMVYSAVLLTVLWVLSGCGTSPTGKSYVRIGYNFSKLDLVAIVNVVGDVESETVKRQIADMFTSQLLSKGYAPVEYQYTQRQLRDKNFIADDLSPGASAIEAGQVLNVPAVMLIEVPLLEDEISITAKILDVDNGSAIWVGNGTKSIRQYITSIDDSSFGDISGNIFPEFDQQASGTENSQKGSEKPQLPLTVAEAKQVEKVIVEICRSLPPKSERARQYSGGGFDWSLLLE